MKRTRLIVRILIVLVAFSAMALAIRIAYLELYVKKSATVVVTDNLIHEESKTNVQLPDGGKAEVKMRKITTVGLGNQRKKGFADLFLLPGRSRKRDTKAANDV